MKHTILTFVSFLCLAGATVMAQDQVPGPMIDSPMKVRFPRPVLFLDSLKQIPGLQNLDVEMLKQALLLNGIDVERRRSLPSEEFYDFRKTSGCSMRVSIWGFVGKPGRYFIPCETTLYGLLTLAGNPVSGAKLDRVRVLRSGAASANGVTRDERFVDLSQQGQTRVYDFNMAEQLQLFPDDLILIDGVMPDR